ncbi:MAG: transposase family protein [Ignavibacteria bacterium]|nr:MAG: transposase family protein [Ignavibacteria bacterium]
MSRKVSRRPRREALQQQRREHQRAAQQLRQQQGAQGLAALEGPALPNGKSEWATVAEEQAGRQQAVEEQIQVFRSLLPTLLKRLAQITDPRNPITLQHQLTVLVWYGILTFVFQMASRREANRRLSRPQFQENLRALFPELESCPPQDTLNRLLADMEVEQIEQAHLDWIQRLMRKKKFNRYLIERCYPIAMDGTQKFSRTLCGAEEWLKREVAAGEGGTSPQYYVYVLEAHLAFSNGMTLPLLSEFLTGRLDAGQSQQDCELKAFQRLATRIKAAFPRSGLARRALSQRSHPRTVPPLPLAVYDGFAGGLTTFGLGGSRRAPTLAAQPVSETKLGKSAAVFLVGESPRIPLRSQRPSPTNPACGGVRGRLGRNRGRFDPGRAENLPPRLDLQ